MDYASLKIEMAGTEYVGLSSADAATLRNSKTSTTADVMPVASIQAFLDGEISPLGIPLSLAIEDLANMTLPPSDDPTYASKAGAKYAARMLGRIDQAKYPAVEVSKRASVDELAGVMVLAGVMSADQRTRLMQVGVVTQRDVTSVYGRDLDFADIDIARAL